MMGLHIEPLSEALWHAIHIALPDVLYPETVFERSQHRFVETGVMKSRRPRPDEVQVCMFVQVWGSTALGFSGGFGCATVTPAYTILVYGPGGAVCVYFNGSFAYSIERPNDTFFDDVKRQCMHEQNGAKERYEGAQ